jgi:hypothetical protein
VSGFEFALEEPDLVPLLLARERILADDVAAEVRSHYRFAAAVVQR